MEQESDATFSALVIAVKHNCAISDARHARDYSLCVYLLRMREYYRWNNNIPLLAKIDIERVGDWVSEQELRWDEIEDEPYRPLVWAGVEHDPFDQESINNHLLQLGFVYSAGIGRMGQAHFALSRLLDHSREKNVERFVCGKELVRDIVNVPAMTRGGQIFLRNDAIRRYLWELYDEWRLHRNTGPMKAVVKHFGMRDDNSLETKLKEASLDLAPMFEAHERGEIEAHKLLGDQYSEEILSQAGSQTEHFLRSSQDLLADSLQTWPLIVQKRSIHYLDFWLAGLTGLRLRLLEQCGIYGKLKTGSTEERLSYLNEIIETEQQRWQNMCEEVLFRARHQSETISNLQKFEDTLVAVS